MYLRGIKVAESLDEFGWLVESMERIREASDADEVTEIMMKAVCETGVEGLEEVSAAAVLICDYLETKVSLQKIRSTVGEILFKGSREGSKSRATLITLATWFVEDLTKDLDTTKYLASRPEVAWEVARFVALRVLQDIARDLGAFQKELKENGAIN